METLNPTTDLLVEDELSVDFEYATVWQRFFNFLIDFFVMRFLFTFLGGLVVYFAINMVQGWPTIAPGDSNEFMFILFGYLALCITYLLYYTICEKLFKGRTLGKLITGTKVVREDGAELTIKDTFKRSLYRIIPFEPFTAFGGHPLHDTKTYTMVIKTR